MLRTINVSDVAGNSRSYYTSYNPEWGDPEDSNIPDFITQREINILNSVPDVTTSVAKPEFVDQVQDAADDAYIVADFSGETTMPEEVFDAIAGTDKTLDLVSEGVT